MRFTTILLATLLSLPAWAQDQQASYTINAMLPGCRAVAKSDWRAELEPVGMYCLGFVVAARTYSLGLRGDIKSCVPMAATNEQVLLVLMKYFDANPERHHESFAIHVLRALRQAWPCKD